MNGKEINLGLIGLGRIGKIHLNNLMSGGPGIKILAVADPDTQNLEIARKSAIPHIFTNTEELFQVDLLDAIIICAPTTTHFDLIQRACAHKLHVFCEKPLDTDLIRILELEEMVRKSGIVLQVGFQRRFDHNFKKIRTRIEEGAIGEPHLMKITSRDPGPPPISYIKTSGGLFMDMTIHDFDMARYLMGCEVTEVFAWGAVRVDQAIGKAGDIDTAIVNLRFENEALVTIDNSRKAVYGYDQRVEVFGPKGMTQGFNNRPDNQVFHDASGSHSSPPYYFFLERYDQAYRDELYAFVDCLRKNSPPEVSIRDAYMSTAIAVAANQSLMEGRVVALAEIIDKRY